MRVHRTTLVLCLILLLWSLCGMAEAQRRRFQLTQVTVSADLDVVDTDDIEECFAAYERLISENPERDFNIVVRLRDSVQSLTPYELHVIRGMREINGVRTVSGDECMHGAWGVGTGFPHDALEEMPCPSLWQVDFGRGGAGLRSGACLSRGSYDSRFIWLSNWPQLPDWPVLPMATVWDQVASLVSGYLMHDLTGQAAPLRASSASVFTLARPEYRYVVEFSAHTLALSAHQRALRLSTGLISQALEEVAAARASDVVPGAPLGVGIGTDIPPEQLAGAYGIPGAGALGASGRVRVYSSTGNFLAEVSLDEFNALGLRLEQHGPASGGRKRKHD